MSECEYFTKYGEGDIADDHLHGVRRASCRNVATLRLSDHGRRFIHSLRMIKMCETHARRVVERFPLLGSLQERFEYLPQPSLPQGPPVSVSVQQISAMDPNRLLADMYALVRSSNKYANSILIPTIPVGEPQIQTMTVDELHRKMNASENAPVKTKHGPGGTGLRGPCDPKCEKCSRVWSAELRAKIRATKSADREEWAESRAEERRAAEDRRLGWDPYGGY